MFNLSIVHSDIIVGYSSPQLSDIPLSPPPSYEAVMKEVRRRRRTSIDEATSNDEKINWKLMEICFLFASMSFESYFYTESITGIRQGKQLYTNHDSFEPFGR